MTLTRERWYDYRERFGDTIAVERMAEDRAASNVGGNGASAGTGGDS
jgi:hypothetical protein